MKQLIEENIAEYKKLGLFDYIGKIPLRDRKPCIVLLDDASMPDDFLIDDPTTDLDDFLKKVEVPLDKHNDTKQMHAKSMTRVVYYVLKDLLPPEQDFRIVVLNNFGDGQRSLRWIIDHQPEIDVVNCSFSSPSKECIDEIKNLGIPITAAVGNNSNKNSISYPAALPETIAVTALIERTNEIANYANRGMGIICACFTDIYIYVDKLMTRKHYYGGTSTATPIISIAIVIYNLMRDIMIRQHEAIQFITDNCIDRDDIGYDKISGYGQFVMPNPDTLTEVEVILDQVPVWAEKSWRWSYDTGINDGKVNFTTEPNLMCYFDRYNNLINKKFI